MTTATKGSKTQEMESKIEALERAINVAAAREEELEDQIVALDAQKNRLVDKRSDVLTDEVVLGFIKKKSAEYDPDKVVRGDRSSPGRMRQICHLFNQLKGAVEQIEKAKSE